jgi:putative acetyltransferase
MLIQNEIAGDSPAIRAVVTKAVRMLGQASGTEAAIVDRLRAEDVLTLSLVAEDGGKVVGYLAASETRIGTEGGLGPDLTPCGLAFEARSGIVSGLMVEAILRLKVTCLGAVLAGSPRY